MTTDLTSHEARQLQKKIGSNLQWQASSCNQLARPRMRDVQVIKLVNNICIIIAALLIISPMADPDVFRQSSVRYYFESAYSGPEQKLSLALYTHHSQPRRFAFTLQQDRLPQPLLTLQVSLHLLHQSFKSVCQVDIQAGSVTCLYAPDKALPSAGSEIELRLPQTEFQPEHMCRVLLHEIEHQTQANIQGSQMEAEKDPSSYNVYPGLLESSPDLAPRLQACEAELRDFEETIQLIHKQFQRICQNSAILTSGIGSRLSASTQSAAQLSRQLRIIRPPSLDNDVVEIPATEAKSILSLVKRKPLRDSLRIKNIRVKPKVKRRLNKKLLKHIDEGALRFAQSQQLNIVPKPYIEQNFKISRAMVERTGSAPKYSQIIIRQPISKEVRSTWYRLRIVRSLLRDISIGIIDTGNYVSQYTRAGILYNGGTCEVWERQVQGSMGAGFKEGDLVEVRLHDDCVEWVVNSKVEATYESRKIKTPFRYFLPMIELRTQGDVVQWVSN